MFRSRCEEYCYLIFYIILLTTLNKDFFFIVGKALNEMGCGHFKVGKDG